MYNSYVAVYIRRSFTCSFSDVESLLLSVDYDDGFIAYLNGVEIARSNMAGTPSYDQTATAQREAGTPELFDITDSAHLLRSGINVVAVEMRNFRATSTDASLIPTLEITGTPY